MPFSAKLVIKWSMKTNVLFGRTKTKNALLFFSLRHNFDKHFDLLSFFERIDYSHTCS